MADNTSSYLKKLIWDPSLGRGLLASFLTNIRVTILIILTIILGGTFALLNIPRRINPQVDIPIVFITTVLPGAGPADVESLVTEPLETAVRSVSGIQDFSSTSSDNVSTIVIEFASGIDADKAKTDVQSAVDTVTSLPDDALDPRVLRLDFEDIPVVTFTMTSTDNPLSLMSTAQTLKDNLEDLPEIENVVLSGFETSEIAIEIKPDALKTYGLNPLTLPQSVQSALLNIPAGFVYTNNFQLPLAIESSADKLTQLRNIVLTNEQGTYRLGDIADISLKSSPRQPNSYYADPTQDPLRAVTISVFKTTSAELERSASVAKETVFSVQEQQPGIRVHILTDFEQNIADQFNDLVLDFSASILLVFLTLLIFLGIKQAGIASFVIPLSFFATFAFMYLFDVELSFLSLFSLLLGLGMIVDDTIVMVSAMTDYYATGKFTPGQTGLLVWRDFIAPTLSSNLTNIWSFLPLLIASGIIGEFTKVISIVVTIALIGSTAIALIITIPLMIFILKPERQQEIIKLLRLILILTPILLFILAFRTNYFLLPIILSYGLLVVILRLVGSQVMTWAKPYLARFQPRVVSRSKLNFNQKFNTGFISAKGPINRYKKFLSQVLKSKKTKRQTLFAVIALAVFSYLLVPLGLVENEFFPKTDQEIVYASVAFPAGTPLETSQAEGLKLLNQLKNYPGVNYAILDIGADVQMTTISSAQSEPNKVRIAINLLEERDLTSIEIAQLIRQDFSQYSPGDFQVVEVSGGPPTGADLQFTILGDDLSLLETYADQAETYLGTIPGVTNLNRSIKPGTSKLIFNPDPNLLSQNGLSSAQIGQYLRALTSGIELDTLKLNFPECQDGCPVQLRLPPSKLSAAGLPAITITNRQGDEIPLTAVGSLSLAPNPTQITHQNGTRSLSVSAAVLPGFNQVEIGNQALNYLTQLEDLDPGYSWETGGVNEENTRSVQSILQAMAIAAVLIMGTMVIELRSFKKALIVMMAIPLAISGVFIVFALTGTPLSFPALIGVLALFGIVVKNSIMIVDKINLNLDIGLPFTEAIADGASSRLEPIIFSSLTNIIGLLPITLADPLWRGLGGAIISGLTLSGLIMLLFIPVVYSTWLKPRTAKRVTSASNPGNK